MNQPQYPKNNELGALKSDYKNNPAYARDLLGFIILFVLAGVIVLVIGFMQNNVRDQLPIMGGGLLLLAIGVKLYFDFRGRLRVSAAVYDDGFVFTDRRNRPILCRWDDVTEVYETVIYRGRRLGHPRWWRYTVHRNGGRPIKLDDAITGVRKLGLVIQKEVDKRLLPQAVEIYKTGETVMFGPQIGLNRQGLVFGQKLLPWKQVTEIKFSKLGSLQINQRDQRRAWKIIPHPKIANYPTLKAMLHQVGELDPSATLPVIHDPQQPPPIPAQAGTAGPPGSIGDLSARLNYDVRELLMAGYSLPQIYGVLQGEYTLEELWQKKPRNKKMNR